MKGGANMGEGHYSRDEMTPERYEAFLAERRAEILDRIATAAARAGRSSREIDVIAVSKTVDIPQVIAAKKVGWTAFGENRPQELRRKTSSLAEMPEMAGTRFDMIGNLQKNKINQVLESGVYLIHSLSSIELARAVSRRAEAHKMVVRVLIESNVSGEMSKSGMTPDEAREHVAELAELPGLNVCGCMTMAPAGDRVRARQVFADLRCLRDDLTEICQLPLPVLSCGMSDDFEEAIEEGSTLVRLGRVVFDPAYTLSS